MKKFLSLVLALLLTLCVALPVMAEEEESYANETLVTWCNTYNNLLFNLATAVEDIEVDMVFGNGAISMRGNEVMYGPTGVPVIHGGALSGNGTVTLGLGTGLEGYGDHWYASLSYSSETTFDTMYMTGLAFILACKNVGFALPDDGSEMMKIAEELLTILVNEENIAIETNGLVFVGKELPGGIHILAVDSLPYYEEFYYNDTENYLILD